MFCKFCGNEIDEDMIVCPKCGKQVKDLKQESTLKRKQIIIIGLIFIIAIAIYLNTQEILNNIKTTEVVTENTDESEEVENITDESEEVENITDESEEVESITDESEENLPIGEGEASKNLEISYFAEKKLLREQSRAQQVEQLTEYVANENLDEDAKSKAADDLAELQARIEKENSSEALLKAKGFSEVYVRIDEDTVDVVVNKAELTDSEMAQIEEIVNRKTGYSVDKINITSVNDVVNN